MPEERPQLLVAGSVALDTRDGPFGKVVETLGGSAVYFALAAAPHARVHLNGIVGRDAAPAFLELLEEAGVGSEGLAISELPTFRWRVRHDFDRWRRGRSAEDLVRDSFGFLLERESKQSILREFDLSLIKRYFPDYDGA